MISNNKEEMKRASYEKKIICGFNIFDIDEARTIVKTAEEMETAIFLMINRVAANHIPLSQWATILRPIAEKAEIPVSIHLDHCYDLDEIRRAIDYGFTSVMYDGSDLTLDENIKNTNYISEYCKKYDVGLEGEVGIVPYDDRPGYEKMIYTTPCVLKRYSEESNVDWIAVSIGQIHRLRHGSAHINFSLLDELVRVSNKPLVIHGGSSIPENEIKMLCGRGISKANVGTKLRECLFSSLREEMNNNPEEYDRFTLFEKPLNNMQNEVRNIIKSFRRE